jgi:hypothetical protein
MQLTRTCADHGPYRPKQAIHLVVFAVTTNACRHCQLSHKEDKLAKLPDRHSLSLSLSQPIYFARL